MWIASRGSEVTSIMLSFGIEGYFAFEMLGKFHIPLYVLNIAFGESNLFILNIFCRNHLSLLPISQFSCIFELCPPQSPYITKTMHVFIYFSIITLKGWPFNKYLILFAYFRLGGVWFSLILSKYGFEKEKIIFLERKEAQFNLQAFLGD